MLNFVLLLLEIALKILNDGTLKKNKNITKNVSYECNYYVNKIQSIVSKIFGYLLCRWMVVSYS